MSKPTVASLSATIETLAASMQALMDLQARTQAQVADLAGQMATLQAQRLEVRVAEKAAPAPQAAPAQRPARKAWSQLSPEEKAEARKAQEAYAAEMNRRFAAAREEAIRTGRSVKVPSAPWPY